MFVNFNLWLKRLICSSVMLLRWYRVMGVHKCYIFPLNPTFFLRPHLLPASRCWPWLHSSGLVIRYDTVTSGAVTWRKRGLWPCLREEWQIVLEQWNVTDVFVFTVLRKYYNTMTIRCTACVFPYTWWAPPMSYRDLYNRWWCVHDDEHAALYAPEIVSIMRNLELILTYWGRDKWTPFHRRHFKFTF